MSQSNRVSRRTVLQAGLSIGALAATRSPAAETPASSLIDFSYAGYAEGETPPRVRERATIKPTSGDDTAAIQAALDEMSRAPLDEKGFRGAVVLSAGSFRVNGSLRLAATGVVLRGSGRGKTRIVATGLSRRTLIEVGNIAPVAARNIVRLESATVGSLVLNSKEAFSLAVGDRVAITRPSTAEWITYLGMDKAEGHFATDRITWAPGSRDLTWDRVVTAVDLSRREIQIDAPITYALENRFGGATLARTTDSPPPVRIGIEDLSLECEIVSDNAADEEHSWIGIALHHVEDAWVRRVDARRFVSSAVRVGHRARRVTVSEVQCLEPVSEIGGFRRQGFLVEGQQVLVRRCRAEQGLNDFATGLLAAGPNVFLWCEAQHALGPSGGFESFSVGTLFDQVRIDGAPLQVGFDTSHTQAAGWTTANTVI